MNKEIKETKSIMLVYAARELSMRENGSVNLETQSAEN